MVYSEQNGIFIIFYFYIHIYMHTREKCMICKVIERESVSKDWICIEGRRAYWMFAWKTMDACADYF